MYEREDGVLLNFHESQSILEITALHIYSNTFLKLEFTFTTFDNIFDSIPELMNPNRKHERHKWVGERLRVDLSSTPPVMALSDSVCSKMIDLQFDENFKPPMGNLNANERQRIHDVVMNAESKRDKHIAEREKARRQREIARIQAIRSKIADVEKFETEEVERCTEALKRAESERLVLEKKAEMTRADLQTKRDRNITDRQVQRIEREEKWLQRVLDKKHKDQVTQEQNLIEWRKCRDDRVAKSRQEEAMFKARMHEIEQRRQEAYDQRELRWKIKESEYLKLRAEKIKAIKRKEIIMKEKRQALAHDLFSSQPIPT